MKSNPLTKQEQIFNMDKARELNQRAEKLSEKIEDEDLAYGVWYNVRDAISEGKLGKAESIVKEYEGQYGPSKQATSYIKQIYKGALTEAKQKQGLDPEELDIRPKYDRERTYDWKDLVGKYIELIDPPWTSQHKRAARRAVIMGGIQGVEPGENYWPMVFSEAWTTVYYRKQEESGK